MFIVLNTYHIKGYLLVCEIKGDKSITINDPYQGVRLRAMKQWQ